MYETPSPNPNFLCYAASSAISSRFSFNDSFRCSADTTFMEVLKQMKKMTALQIFIDYWNEFKCELPYEEFVKEWPNGHYYYQVRKKFREYQEKEMKVND